MLNNFNNCCPLYHNYVGIIGGSLFVEVLDHSLIQQQCFAMHALSCDQQISIDRNTIAQFQETVYNYNFIDTPIILATVSNGAEKAGHH